MNSSPILELTRYLLKNLADHPDEAFAHETEENGLVHLRLNVAEEDKGRIIGKQGKVIKAMRSVVTAVAVKIGKKASLDLD